MHKDPFRVLGRLKIKQRCVLSATQLEGLDILRRASQTAMDMWTYPKMEAKTICLPSSPSPGHLHSSRKPV